MNKIRILNICIDNLSRSELLEQLTTGTLFTPNVDHLIKLQQDKSFLEAYHSADYIICDSQIIFLISILLGTPFKEKISGSDFFPAFYEYHRNNEDIKIFLLGGKEGGGVKGQEKINAKMQRPIIIGAHSPSLSFEKNEKEGLEIVDMINQSGATVLALGVGAPKQEKWIYKYKNQFPNIKIFLGVGATIDFEAGTLKRAPKWMSNLGLESLYRLLREPRRLWKRYLIEHPPIFWLILKQKLNWYVDPWNANDSLSSDRTEDEQHRTLKSERL